MNTVYMPGLPSMPSSLLASSHHADAPLPMFSIDNQWLMNHPDSRLGDPVTPRGPTTSSRPPSAIDARFYEEVTFYLLLVDVDVKFMCFKCQ